MQFFLYPLFLISLVFNFKKSKLPEVTDCTAFVLIEVMPLHKYRC